MNHSETTTSPNVLRLLRANLRTSLLIALVVGSSLVLINHGDHLADEPVCDSFYLKCGLCYMVPFLVSMVSALLAARTRLGARHDNRP